MPIRRRCLWLDIGRPDDYARARNCLRRSGTSSNRFEMPSVLITGVSSFTGLHLARYLDFVGFKPIFGCDISEPRQKISFSEFLDSDIGEPANVASVFDYRDS